MSTVIGAMGKRGTGKDTIADYLVANHGFTRVAFADALYQEVSEYFKVPVCVLQNRKLKERPLIFEGIYALDGKSPRQALQDWGTMRRAEDPGYWVNKVKERVGEIDGAVIITDVRFINEVDTVKSLEGFLMRVKRPHLEGNRSQSSADMHVSETEVDNVAEDILIINKEDDLSYLHKQIEEAIQQKNAA